MSPSLFIRVLYLREWPLFSAVQTILYQCMSYKISCHHADDNIVLIR